MERHLKAYTLFCKIYNDNTHFKEIITKNIETGLIRFFNEEEWEKIESQNFISPIPEMSEFLDMFNLGYNIGNCVGASKQLSYSYDDVDIVSGILPIIKGTRNAEKKGGHCWLETDKYIIDTSLMLIIDKILKQEMGYIEEQRLTSYQLSSSAIYQARKEFVNDKSIKKTSEKEKIFKYEKTS